MSNGQRKTRFVAWAAGVCGALALGSCGGGDLDLEKLGFVKKEPGSEGRLTTTERNFAILINNYASANAPTTPWVGSWWPYTSNGVAEKTDGNLSPVGKYDAARGSCTGEASAQAWEIRHHGSRAPNIRSWSGHCNGWSVAAALFPEPRTPKVVNGVGFTPAEQKGIVSEAAMLAHADMYGNRVYEWDSGTTRERKLDDVTPNVMFLVLTNYSGKNREPVLLDQDTDSAVWNQPLAGYRYTYPKPEDVIPHDGSNIHKVKLGVTIWWARDYTKDLGRPTPDFNMNEPDPEFFESRDLTMELWLDGPIVFGADGKVTSSGNIVVTRDGEFLIGGAWTNGNYARTNPDYMWVPFSLINMADPENQRFDPLQDDSNPKVDAVWVVEHILQGVDDPSLTPCKPEPAPNPTPTGTATSTSVSTSTSTSVSTGASTGVGTGTEIGF